MTSTSTQNASGTTRKRYDFHTIMLGLGATFLTGAVLWFNGSYGMTFSYGMAAAFIGFAICKDAAFAYAWATRNRGGRVAAGLLSIIAFGICCLAAIGAASHGRQEAADPKAALITRYDTAERQLATANKRLAELGKVLTAADAEAKASAALAAVERGIAKRTNDCTVLAREGVGARVVAVNREACQPYIAAKASIEAAKEAATLRTKVDAAEAIIAEGRPASADAQASTLAVLLGVFWAFKGIEGIQAWTNLFIGLGLEIGSPLAWAAFAAALRSQNPETPAFTASEARETFAEAPERSFEQLKADALANATERSPLAALFDDSFPNVQTAEILTFPTDPNGSGPKGGRRTRRTDRKTAVLEDIVARRDRGERFGSQENLRAVLSERFGHIGRSTLSNWLDELDGTVQRQQVGRCKAVG